MPSGIVVACQNERSQHKNRSTAMKMLKAKLYELEVNKRNAAAKVLEDSKSDVSWGNQIRSYVLDQSRIKDLRTGVEVGNTTRGARRRPRSVPGSLAEGGRVAYDGRRWQCSRREQADRRAARQARANCASAGAPHSRTTSAATRSRRSCTPPSASATRAWLEANPTRVQVGGRMMFKRVMGKASFAKIADRTGQIQLFLQADALGAAYEAFKGWDVGDILGAQRRAVPDQDRRAVGARRQRCACW